MSNSDKWECVYQDGQTGMLMDMVEMLVENARLSLDDAHYKRFMQYLRDGIDDED